MFYLDKPLELRDNDGVAVPGGYNDTLPRSEQLSRAGLFSLSFCFAICGIVSRSVSY
ncbi:MAG TPA: hypothetical protein VFD70_07815 [Anaerolineae bacterium]|nr:hypothetical protein [Anaerolineae bacterium]